MTTGAAADPAARDRWLRGTRAIAWMTGLVAAGLTAAFSIAAAHAFKGHDGRAHATRVSATAGRSHSHLTVPPPQHVPAISGAPTPLQAPSQPPAAAAPSRHRRPRCQARRDRARDRAVARARHDSERRGPPTTGDGGGTCRRRGGACGDRPVVQPVSRRLRAFAPQCGRRPAGPGEPAAAEAIVAALRAAELSNGAVDPTVGEALILAGYDRTFSAGLREPPQALSARRVPGWRAVCVDRARGRVTIPAGVRLDLGATAKALAADRAATAAAAAAGCGVLVNLGGDIAVAGTQPPEGWPVRVADDHRASLAAPGQSLTIRSGGLATSSTTARCWGTASHHIIDPRTSRPTRSRWRTVSVAAGSCVDANTASTAAIVLDDAAPDWLESHRLPARLVARDGAVLTVAGWPAERVAA